MHRFLRDHGFIIDRVEYPYFETRYFTQENLMRLFDTDRISPPFYGNFMTFYCRKPCDSQAADALRELGRDLLRTAEDQRAELAEATEILRAAGRVSLTGVPETYRVRLDRVISLDDEARERGAGIVLRRSAPEHPAAIEFHAENRGNNVTVTLQRATPERELDALVLLLEAIAKAAGRRTS
jgi:hypothetical protein